MKLPKGVVKGVKDNFDVDALELKCRQQEEKIKKLNRDIILLKWKNLSEDERRGAFNAFVVLTGIMFPMSSDEIEFITKYIEQQEAWEAISCTRGEELPF